MVIDPEIIDSAADWHAHLEGDAPDYDGFAAWLEADERHRLAYDRIITLDTLITDHGSGLAPPAAANDDVYETGRSRWRWPGVAAAIALVIGGSTFVLRGDGGDQIAVATKAGQSQVVQLADASAVTVDADSAISYPRGNQRAISLTRGSALFSVKHDAARPFAVKAGGYQIRDLGTEFSVSRSANHLTVSVSSGLVDISGPGVPRLSVMPGERLDIANGKFEKSRVDPESVGSWRQGRLIYDNIPLRLVVGDINRYADHHVQIDPTLSDRRFSGVLTIGDGTQLAPTLASVMAISIRKDDSGIHLESGRSR